MANDPTVEGIRKQLEGDLDLAFETINKALEALEKEETSLEDSGDSPETLALVVALISYLNKLLQRRTEINLATLGQSEAIQNAIKTLKTEGKELNDLVDQGLANAKNLERAKQVAEALGKGLGALEEVTKESG